MSQQVCFRFDDIDDVISALEYIHAIAVDMDADSPEDTVIVTVMNAMANALDTITTTEIYEEAF